MDVPKILVDVERMRYPNTGLYHYCLRLGNNLLDQQHLHKAQLNLYVRKEDLTAFKDKTPHYFYHSFQKYAMSFTRKYDLWHCTFQGSNYFPFTSKNKIAITIHDLNFLYEEMHFAKRNKKLHVLQKKINRADAIITVSEFVRNEVLTHLNAANKFIQVIYNGCNVDGTSVSSLPVYVPERPYIFTIGLIDEKKNMHVLPNMLINNDYYLIIAGAVHNEDYKKRIISVARKLNVDNRIHFTGVISETEKYWYLQNCLAFAFPSIAEGFGLPVIEAMHFGKPVILSKATSLPEIGGECAYYFDSFESKDMNTILERALQDHSAKNKSQQIINWSKKFNWQTTAQQHWQLYEYLLSI